MKDSKIKLPFGINAENLLVHVADVEGGKSCNCSCPACRSPLIAAKGQHNQHHFRHAVGKECAAGLESAIHLAAKLVIKESKRVVLPELVITAEKTDVTGVTHRERQIVVEQNTVIELDSVDEEATLAGIRVDILGTVRETPLIIEIFYRHEVDGEKLEKILDASISAVEIDLSDLSQEDVKDWDAFRACVHDPQRVRWLHNDKAKRLVYPRIESLLSEKVESVNHNHMKARQKRDKERREHDAEIQKEKARLVRALSELNAASNREHIAQLASTAEAHPAWRYSSRYLPFTWDTLPEWLNASVTDGDWIFGCDRRVWQAAFYSYFVRWRKKGKPFSVEYVDRWLQKRASCKVPSCVRTVGILGRNHTRVIAEHSDKQELPSTWTSIREYCDVLCGIGMLDYSGPYGEFRRGGFWFKVIRIDPLEEVVKPALLSPPALEERD